ncbi:MAG: YgiT-type zinc finger protein [Candidatus Brocadiales bacterium]|nr:YgiT-type zinc finger protein [Candidatus Brocadiales bacterium]
MARKKTGYDYGECGVCGAQLLEKLIKQDFWIRGELVVIEDVPAGVCSRCGENVVKADIGRMIANLIANTEQIAKSPKISVPAIKFKKQAEKSRL